MKIKKLFVALLAVCMALSVAACGGGTGTTGTPAQSPAANGTAQSPANGGNEADSDNAVDKGPYAGLDTSTPVTINWYVLGDLPPDMQIVLDEANSKYLQPVLNATLQVQTLSWSEYSTKYPLVLAGGEECDLIYTAAWCYLQQEGSKGAFKELTDEFLQTYMPQTWENQAKDSWEQVKIGGKVVAVTRNYLPMPNYKFMAIREDIREKYNLPEIKDLDSLQQYLFTVAENEPSMQGLAAPGNNAELRDILVYQNNNVYAINGMNNYYIYQDKSGVTTVPRPEDIEFLFTSDYYKDFAELMVTWADKGVWSKNAINNTISTADAFEQGKSAILPWVDAVYGYGQNLEAAGNGTAAYIDATPDCIPRQTGYSGDCYAIANNSKNPERAAMVLDMMKFDKDLNMLMIGGIEGKHYTLNADNTYNKGPDADNYGWRCIGWALPNEDMPTLAGQDPREIACSNSIKSKEKPLPIDGFQFDESAVKAELAVVNSLWQEYSPAFELGVYGADTSAKFEEFRAKMDQAGLPKVMDEVRRQYGEYLASKGL